ncbi:sensor histidine kinase [Nocardiopsis eucommiae]|uniref:sensor histidine kinase n=1 Tax=Nocardiopsis eucommiae TaxID=2831970 RepID=UPI003D7165A8
MRPPRLRPLRAPVGHLALATVLLLLSLAPVMPLLVMAVPAPALLAGRLSRDPRVAGYAFTVVGLAGVAALVFGGHPVGMWVTGGVLAAFAVVLPWLLGLYLRSTSALERAGWERARTLDREWRLMTERARMRERSRIAHDLHDAVGHQLSLLTLGAGALETAPDLPEERRVQAGQLREAAGRAAEQLMVAVGVLRADTGSAPPAPEGEGVTALVEHSREAGLRVSLETEGTRVQLPVMSDRALYRVVQEALTNAAKHAPSTDPRVVLHGLPDGDGVRVTVTNPLLRRDGAPRRVPGTGGGLVGLRERVRLAGGEFSAGPEGGHWVVSARLPGEGPGPFGAGAGAAVLGASRDGEAHDAGPVGDGTVRDAAGGARGESGAVSEGGFAGEPLHPGPDLLGGPGDAVSREEDAHPHRRVRRRTLWAISTIVLVPVLTAMVGYGLLLAFSMSEAANSTLDPELFERLRPGQERAEVEALLPDRELHPGTHTPDAWPEDPEGQECRYYRSSEDVVSGEDDRFRLCFDPDRLVSVEVLPW